MQAVFLSGNSLKNKEFIESLQKDLGYLFESSQIQYYKHWQTGDPLIDLDYETKALVSIVKDMNNYVVIAKSAGIIVTLNSINLGLIKPAKCVFLGTPADWARKQGFDIDRWLTNYSVPTLFIQNKKDPMYSSEDLNNLLISSHCKNFSFSEMDGDTHEYTKYEFLRPIVDYFINKE